MSHDEKPAWWIYKGTGQPHDDINRLPLPPPWRQFTAQARAARGTTFQPTEHEIEQVNAALYLRRPLLVTGKPGVGKTSLTYAVAHELNLGKVLRWSITTQTTLKDGLYNYDAIARLQEASLHNDAKTPPSIGKYLRLGPLGTAFAASKKPRVLLIDEIDKSDIDLPNDLLHIFEEGEFMIPELARLPEDQSTVYVQAADAETKDAASIAVTRGSVHCTHFPLVIMTSNGEREFPPAFLRRCLPLEMVLPQKDRLARIVRAHLKLSADYEDRINTLIEAFLKRRDDKKAELATDQLLNAVFLALKDIDPERHYPDREALIEALWKPLSL
ncbi:MAG: MoxR family ATPase [Candidatus Competibacteraceae bacterium]|nr:MoxR family ATPase [Caldilineaceae bacterium]MCB1810451.1 MoxR family ATPase [Candidatus Competibacteraceae bacterium]